MAKLIFGMSQSLDGYVDGPESNLIIPALGPVLFGRFIEQVRSEAGALYGSRIYALMRYWDELEVAGPTLAASLTSLGLIDEYQLYFRPYVLGSGKPFFVGARPPLFRQG